MDHSPAQPAPLQPPGGHGRLFLHDPDLMPLKCTLVELGAEHCRGAIRFSALDPEVILAWQQKLIPQQKLRMRMELLRGVPGFEVEGVVLRVNPMNDGVEIDFSFVRSDSARRSEQAAVVAAEEEPETIAPIDQGEPRGGKHKSSIIETLTPLAPDDLALVERPPEVRPQPEVRPPSSQVVTQSGLRRKLNPDEMVQMERPKDLQTAYMALHRAAGSAAVDAGGAPPGKAGMALHADPRDATVAMDRPKPASSTTMAKQAPQAASLPDATVFMERPHDLQKKSARTPEAKVAVPGATAGAESKPSSSAPDATVIAERPREEKPAATAPPLDATVVAERPANAKPAPALDATVVADRPAGAKQPAASPLSDATVDMTRTAANAGEGRRVERRGSGIYQPDPAKTESGAIRSKQLFSKKLGEVLVQMGKLTPEQVDEVVKLAIESGERIGRLLIAWEMVPPDVLCRALSIQSGMPMTLLDEVSIPEKLRKIFPLPLMMRHSFVPFDESAAVLCVAACNPLEPETVKDLERISRKVVEVFLAREDHVARQLDWLRVKMKTRSRRGMRFRLHLPASYQFCSRMGVRSDKDVFDAATVNISEGGFLIDSPQVPGDPGELLLRGLYVNICLKPMSGEIWSICDVREIRLVQDQPPRWLLGMEIVDINEESRARLKELCKSAKSAKAGKS